MRQVGHYLELESPGLHFLNSFLVGVGVVLFLLAVVPIKCIAQPKQFYYVILAVKEFCKILKFVISEGFHGSPSSLEFTEYSGLGNLLVTS